jgi:hypothetical protein
MKKYLSLTTAFALLASGYQVSAQTIFNGGSTSTAGNWSNGLPTSVGNPGSIAVNGTLQNMDTYFVTQTAGTLNATGGRTFTNGTYNMTGGSMTLGTNGVGTSGTQVFTLNGGSIESGTLTVNAGTQFNLQKGSYTISNTTRDVNIGGNFVMSGGTLSVGRDTLMAKLGGTFTMSDGLLETVDFGADIAADDGGATINLNGGTIQATGDLKLYGDTNPNTFTLGGSTVGSFTAINLVGTVGNYTINWLSGTLMTMNITGMATWAETEYNAGRLLFNGQNNVGLGLTWTEATSGGTQIWNYSGTTLSVIPEPSTWALLSVGLGVMVLFRRRRRAC